MSYRTLVVCDRPGCDAHAVYEPGRLMADEWQTILVPSDVGLGERHFCAEHRPEIGGT